MSGDSIILQLYWDFSCPTQLRDASALRLPIPSKQVEKRLVFMG